MRPATVLTAASANSLRSAMVRLSDSPLWCGQEIAVAPVRTWKSRTFSKVARSRLKSSLSGVTGLCITPRNLLDMGCGRLDDGNGQKLCRRPCENGDPYSAAYREAAAGMGPAFAGTTQ